MEDAQHVGPNPDVISNRGLVNDRGFDRSDREVEREVDRSSDREVDRSDRGFDRRGTVDNDYDSPGPRRERFRGHFEDATREVNGDDRSEEPEDHREQREAYAPKAKRSVRDDTEAAVVEVREREGYVADTNKEQQDVPEAEAAPREAQTNQAPTSWTEEARNSWAKIPERIKQEVWKRETDMERGVKAIKDRYKEIDDVIAPYHDHIQGYGKTAAQTVDQMFKWYDALAKNPDEAIPALVRSYGHNPYRAATALIPDVAARFNNMNQELQILRAYAAHINPQVRAWYQQHNNNGRQQQYLQHLVNQAVAQQVHQQTQQQAAVYQRQVEAHQQQAEREKEAATTEWLEGWGKDKRHFKTVRVLMGQLLTPDQTTGQAPIPLTADNRVDLDGAYEAAVMLHPELKKARQQAKEKQVRQQEKARQARSTAVSIAPSPPGYNNGGGRGSGQKKGVSVRESLRQAISELSDR